MCAHTRTRKPSSCSRRTEPVWESAGASETRRRKKGRKGAKGGSSLLRWPYGGGLRCWGLPFGAGTPSSPPLFSQGWLLCAPPLCSCRQPPPQPPPVGSGATAAHLARPSFCGSLGSAVCLAPRGPCSWAVWCKSRMCLRFPGLRALQAWALVKVVLVVGCAPSPHLDMPQK